MPVRLWKTSILPDNLEEKGSPQKGAIEYPLNETMGIKKEYLEKLNACDKI